MTFCIFIIKGHKGFFTIIGHVFQEWYYNSHVNYRGFIRWLENKWLMNKLSSVSKDNHIWIVNRWRTHVTKYFKYLYIEISEMMRTTEKV